MLKACDGSIGKAIQLKDNQDTYLELQKILSNLGKTDIIDIFKHTQILYNKENIQKMLEYINIVLLIYAKQDARYADCIKVVEETKKRLNFNTNFDMTIDNMLLQMKENLKN